MYPHRLLPLLVLVLAACTGDPEPENTPPREAAPASQAANPQVEPVAVERMQALLPNELVGRPRSDVSGSVRGALGVSTSVVRAAYGRADSLVTVTLTDIGGLGSPATLGYGWVGEGLDRTWDEGAERTLQIDGYPAYERTEHHGPDAVHVFVGNRIVVEVRSDQVDLATLRRALDQVPLDRLAALPDDER